MGRYQLFHILTLDQIIMKFAVALSFLAAMAEANPWGYWGYRGYWGYPYRGIKLGPKHEWVEGYGYAIPQAKPAEERKKREAEAAVLGTTHSAPAVPIAPVPYHLGAAPAALLPAVPHSAAVEHKGTEVIPGEVSVGAPIATVGYGLPLWGRKKREAEAEADPEAWYYGYYGHHLGYYGGYYGHPYGYGYYGHPYGYGYGYYG